MIREYTELSCIIYLCPSLRRYIDLCFANGNTDACDYEPDSRIGKVVGYPGKGCFQIFGHRNCQQFAAKL